MARKHLLYLVACTILFSSSACSNEDLIEETELVSESQITPPHRIKANLNPKDYNVNIDMVKGYLMLTKRIDDLRSITPLTIEEDTLAWAVQYRKGWQVLSGDILNDRLLWRHSVFWPNQFESFSYCLL